MSELFQELVDGKGRVAILIDPEKNTNKTAFKSHIQTLISAKPDLFFVGGSTGNRAQTENCVSCLKAETQIPVVLFPGNSEQFSAKANAILFLSLLTSRNPKYIIEEQIKSAAEVYLSGIQTIPTGYILIDGGTHTSTLQVTQSTPIAQESLKAIVDTALAGTLMGHKALYIDAGSGATTPISEEIIRTIAPLTQLLIIGGGLRNIAAIKKAHLAGAKVVVIGNQLEKDASFAKEIATYQEQRNRSLLT
jgi:putative glycerol-1-phosphate prenyltransferase